MDNFYWMKDGLRKERKLIWPERLIPISIHATLRKWPDVFSCRAIIGTLVNFTL